MEIRDVGSNSYKSKAQVSSNAKKSEDDTKHTPRVNKVATGVKVKPTKTSKMMDIFFPEGINADDIWDYLLRERIAPGIMSGLRSFADDVLDAIFGTPRRGSRDTIYRRDRYTPYSSVSSLYTSDKDKRDSRERDRDRRTTHRSYDYASIAFRSRAEAEEVLDELEMALQQYHIVTVADLYDAAGEDPEPTDYLYGWTSLRNARVEKIAGGNFVISLPKASPID